MSDLPPSFHFGGAAQGRVFPFWSQWLLAAMIAGLLARGMHPRTLLLTGFIFGLGQWIVLYPELRSVRSRTLTHALWLPATALSGLVGYLLIASLGVQVLGPVLIAFTSPYENSASHLIFLTFLWGMIGLGQWPLLRETLPQAGRWVLISACGGAAGSLVDLALQAAGVEMHTSLPAGTLAGAAYGLVTGRFLARLRRLRRHAVQVSKV
jgi:hypothetical protein